MPRNFPPTPLPTDAAPTRFAAVELGYARRTLRPEPGADRGRARRTRPRLLRVDRRDRGGQVAPARRARPVARRTRVGRPDPGRGRRTASYRPVRVAAARAARRGR